VVGLVDHDHVRDLHHACLERLDRVARAGHEHEHDRVGVVDDVDLRLTDPDRLDEHVLPAGGVEQESGLQRRLRQPPERAAVGHRADEDPLIEKVLGQPDPVAEQRPMRERRGRVDREDADGSAGFARRLRERADQGGLADARRSGETHDRRLARVGIYLLDELPTLRPVVLDERDRACQRAAVAVEQALRECGFRHRGAIIAGGGATPASLTIRRR
jgi:hypothetical protein